MVDRRAAYRVHACLALLCCIDSIIPTLSFTSAPQIFRPNVHSFCSSAFTLRSPGLVLKRAAASGAKSRRPAIASRVLMSALPEGWQEYTDEATGMPYYYDTATGATQWDKPAETTATATIAAPAPASFPSPSPSTPSPAAERMSVTDEYLEIEECSKFFVQSFWEKGTTEVGAVELNGAQRKAVEEEQGRDMKDRYGKLLGDRKLKSALVIMRDESGQIEGCCGVELAVADTDAFKPLPRSDGENMLKGGLAALGGRARNELRGKPVQFVAASVLPDGYALIPVLSNLAVCEKSRGRGLARQLARRCEVISASWGFSEMMLLVEEGNGPARNLYESLGYQRIWTRDVPATRISQDGKGGSLTMERVSTLAMAKAL